MKAPKAARLNEMLDERFDIRLDFDADYDVSHLRSVLEHYLDKRVMMLAEHGEAGALASPDYAKAVMISEAVRLFLREIAPKRQRKNNKR